MSANGRGFNRSTQQLNLGVAGTGTSEQYFAEARGAIEGAVNHMRRRAVVKVAPLVGVKPHYVDPSRLAELRALSGSLDATRLVRLCEEVNDAHASGAHIATAMLV